MLKNYARKSVYIDLMNQTHSNEYKPCIYRVNRSHWNKHLKCYFYRQPPGSTPAHEQKLFLVAESSLLSLFEFCPVCRAECDKRVNSRIGTRITVMQKCLSCSFTRSWDSQPSIGDTPLGNIMMSSGILFGGGSPAKVLKIMSHMNVLTIGYSTFMKHQKKYLHAAVERTYRDQQSSLLDSIKAEGKELILGGDGRCDSPGHSAKYGSYSLMDLEQNKILDSQLVQVGIKISIFKITIKYDWA